MTYFVFWLRSRGENKKTRSWRALCGRVSFSGVPIHCPRLSCARSAFWGNISHFGPVRSFAESNLSLRSFFPNSLHSFQFVMFGELVSSQFGLLFYGVFIVSFLQQWSQRTQFLFSAITFLEWSWLNYRLRCTLSFSLGCAWLSHALGRFVCGVWFRFSLGFQFRFLKFCRTQLLPCSRLANSCSSGHSSEISWTVACQS